jgi:hypothetical protein
MALRGWLPSPSTVVADLADHDAEAGETNQSSPRVELDSGRHKYVPERLR